MRNTASILWLLTIILGFSSCYTPGDEEEKLDSSEVVSTQSASNSLLADGFSQTKIYVYLPYDAAKSKRGVTLETIKGKFQNNAGSIVLEADSVGELMGTKKRIAQALLQSDVRIGKAVITAKIDAYSSKTTVDFTNAIAEAVKVSANRFSVINGFKKEVLLTAQLTRILGIPSVGSIVKFEIRDSTGAIIADSKNFREPKLSSDETGKATVIYSPGNLNYTGRLFAIASVPANSAVSPDTTFIYVYDK